MMDRYQGFVPGAPIADSAPLIVLLPGSRSKELKRHLPPMLGALKIIQATIPNLRARMILPSQTLMELAAQFSPPSSLEVRCGGLSESLALADVAIASTGTVTMECAYFGVPAVTLYKASTIEFEIGKTDRQSQILDHAQFAGERGGVPGIHPKCRHAGKSSPTPRWNFCATRRAAKKFAPG